MIVYSLDYQVVDLNFNGTAIRFDKGKDDVEHTGEFRPVGLGIGDFGADAVCFDFDFLQCQALCEGKASEEVGCLVHLQVQLVQTLQPIDRNGSQRNLCGGAIVELVGDFELEFTFFSEFVSGVDGLGGAFGREERERDLASGGDVVLPGGNCIVPNLELAAGERDGGTCDDVQRGLGNRDDRGLGVLRRGRVHRSDRRYRSRINRLRTAAGSKERQDQESGEQYFSGICGYAIHCDYLIWIAIGTSSLRPFHWSSTVRICP